MVKMTKKDYLKVLRGLAEQAGEVGAVEFCDKEIVRLENRKSTPTKVQKENEGLAELVYETLKGLEAPSTLKAIQEANEDLAQYSNQKMSALLKKLVDANRVVRVKEKKTTLYSIAEDND